MYIYFGMPLIIQLLKNNNYIYSLFFFVSLLGKKIKYIKNIYIYLYFILQNKKVYWKIDR